MKSSKGICQALPFLEHPSHGRRRDNATVTESLNAKSQSDYEALEAKQRRNEDTSLHDD